MKGYCKNEAPKYRQTSLQLVINMKKETEVYKYKNNLISKHVTVNIVKQLKNNYQSYQEFTTWKEKKTDGKMPVAAI